MSLDAGTGDRTFAGGVSGPSTRRAAIAYFGGAGTAGQQVVVTVTPPASLTDGNGRYVSVLALTLDNGTIRCGPWTRSTKRSSSASAASSASTPTSADGTYSATFQVTANYL